MSEIEPAKKTVGSHFHEIPDAGRERTLELLSDGELQLSSVKDYDDWEELLESCRETIAARKSFRFPGTRRACADLMDAVMQHSRREHRARPPKCWLFIIRKLREEDGPVLIQPRDPEPPKPPCPYGGAIDSLLFQLNGGAPYDVNKLLTQQAARLPVPEGWTESLIFVEDLLAHGPNAARLLTTLRDELRRRVADLPSEMRRKQEGEYRKRTEERTGEEWNIPKLA
jgi:hypothetical protein